VVNQARNNDQDILLGSGSSPSITDAGNVSDSVFLTKEGWYGDGDDEDTDETILFAETEVVYQVAISVTEMEARVAGLKY